jgi:hypothetical protein
MITIRTRDVCHVGILLGALFSTGCASGGAGMGAGGPPSAIAVGASGGSQRGVGIEMTVRNDGQQFTVAAAPDAVFDALEASYAALQIPLSRREPTTRLLGNDGLKMRRALGKIELRRAFDCGGTSGMPNAETYMLTVTIISNVMGDDAQQGATVKTVIDASAENPNYPGSGVRCSSTGSFEEAIAKEVRARLNAR